MWYTSRKGIGKWRGECLKPYFLSSPRHEYPCLPNVPEIFSWQTAHNFWCLFACVCVCVCVVCACVRACGGRTAQEMAIWGGGYEAIIASIILHSEGSVKVCVWLLNFNCLCLLRLLSQNIMWSFACSIKLESWTYNSYILHANTGGSQGLGYNL